MSSPSIHEILEKAFYEAEEFHNVALSNVEFQYSVNVNGKLKLISTDVSAKTIAQSKWGRK